MLLPVRCFSCGKVIGNKWRAYNYKTAIQRKTAKQAFHELTIKRYCCKQMFICNYEFKLHTTFQKPIFSTKN